MSVDVWEPKPINEHGQTVEGGHVWTIDKDDGLIDVWAFRTDIHNGPRCNWCGVEFCVFCDLYSSGESKWNDVCFGVDAHLSRLAAE